MLRRAPRRAGLVGVLAVALAATTAACGASEPANTPQRLVIGVSAHQPGLGERSAGGEWSGFEVDLARYLARGLGFADDEVVFTEVVPANREQMLASGDVDLVLAQYTEPEPEPEPADDEGDDGDDVSPDPSTSGTPDDPEVEFSTPYFTAHQDLLVATDDETGAVTDLDSLDDPDKTLCSVTGSGKAQRVRDDYAPLVDLQEFDSYTLCVDALLEGRIDAVTTDDIVLAGYAEQHPGRLRVLGTLYSPVEYAVGLPAGAADRDAVDDLIARAIADGTWARALEANLGHTAWDPPPAPGATS